ncbi:MAG: CheR family methyltransferase [Cyclobacteriaceae bacterium]
MLLGQTSLKITLKAFNKISVYVKDNYGINLTESKLYLVENRLQGRIRNLELPSFDEYTDHIFSNQGKDELSLLCDFLSTNKTFFYREKAHFDFLQKFIANRESNSAISIWSAACSAGDEVYTIISLLEASKHLKPIQFSVLGTDISSKMIDEAQRAEYLPSRVNFLPAHLSKILFEKKISSDDKQKFYVVKPEIKQYATFKKFNLIQDIPLINQQFDIIFCRNVLIYFEERTKRNVVDQLIKKIKPGGYLILGHCEGILCNHTNLKQIQPAVFQKLK